MRFERSIFVFLLEQTMKTKEIKILGNECGECGGCFDVVAGEPLVLYQLCGRGNHTTTLRLGEGARAKVVFAALESGDTTYNFRVELNGRGAELELFGLFVAMQGDKCKGQSHLPASSC